MARGINKVIIIGNLGGDPDTRYMPSGNAVATLSVATTESWKDKQSGEKQERTEWHRIVFYNRLAEISGEYLRKGSKVYVEGSLRTRKWQDKSGMDRYTTEIVGSTMQMLDSRGSSGSSFNQSQPSEDSQSSQSTSQPQSQSQPAAEPVATAAVADENFDDDIPF